MHLPQHKLCTREMELELEVKFHIEFNWVTRPWRRTLTNAGSDVKFVFPRCPPRKTSCKLHTGVPRVRLTAFRSRRTWTPRNAVYTRAVFLDYSKLQTAGRHQQWVGWCAERSQPRIRRDVQMRRGIYTERESEANVWWRTVEPGTSDM